MKIEVTQRDIDNGEQLQAYSCPIALALKRKTRKKCGVSCDGFWWPKSLEREGIIGIRKRRKLPPHATQFANDFDDGKTVEPFTFTVRK